MEKCVYLYGVDPSKLPSLTKGLIARNLAAKKLLKKLLDTPYSDRDDLRISRILEAIDRNTKLLNGEL